MNRSTKTTLFLITLFSTSAIFSSHASADGYRYNVNYDYVIEHSHDLQYIAEDLKDCIREQFRGAKYYGKLRSNAGTIKHRAHRLHRIGVDHGNCRWDHDIARLDRLVCELSDNFEASIAYSRRGYDRPISRNAERTVRKLIRKANYHVTCLKDSYHRVEQHVERPVYVEPSYSPVIYEEKFHQPIIEQPAPNYAPNVGIELGVYRSGKTYGNHRAVKNSYTTSQRSHSYKPHGKSKSKKAYSRGHHGKAYDKSVALQFGGFKIHFK